MDDFNVASLQESRNEWVSRLINLLAPFINEGFKSVFTEAYKMCMEADEEDKYLMTFQNFISRIPKWNDEMIQDEVKRITEKSSCGYIEDLITCVHVIQLKALTCVRVGKKQKKIDLNIPKLKDFVHKIYIHVARKLYTNIYLFEKDIPPLQVQKNNREFETIIKECIVDAVRDSIPTEHILRSYLEESVEDEVEANETLVETKRNKMSEQAQEDDTENNITEIVGNVKEENKMVLKTNDNLKIDENEESNNMKLEVDDINNDVVKNKDESNDVSIGQMLQFSDVDKMIDEHKREENVSAPKSVERLEIISNERNEARKMEELTNMDDDDEKLKISMEDVQLNFEDLGSSSMPNNDLVVLDDVELLV
tara:strand:+ start:871 stop:1971 length:1101 start_codon:yes stop_codon:yes gene_type:complete